jgi:hypothetical protein
MSTFERIQFNSMPIYHNWINKMVLARQAGNEPSSYPNDTTAVEEDATELNPTTTPSSTSASRKSSYYPANSPCHEFIRAYLMDLGNSDDWRKYNLYVQFPQGERLVALDEKPMQIIKEYQHGQFSLRRV